MTVRKTLDQMASDDLDSLYERVSKAEQEADAAVAAAAHLTTLVGKRSEKAERTAKEQQRRADIAETELHVLRSGLRANGADPTQIQNLWAQIRLRNRQWRDEKRRAEQAEGRLSHLQATSETAGILLTRTTDECDQLRATIARVRAVVHVADDEDVTDWQRGFHTCSVVTLAALDEPAPGPATEHVYLSTGCLHGRHDYCQSMTGMNGAKRPASCKFCRSVCVCPCHTDQPKEQS